jgi:hypothetical protein
MHDLAYTEPWKMYTVSAKNLEDSLLVTVSAMNVKYWILFRIVRSGRDIHEAVYE